jgi:protein-serine/threonine kinase
MIIPTTTTKTTTARMPSTKNSTGDVHFHQKFKAFFTRNSGNRDRAAETAAAQNTGASHGPPRSDNKSAFRQTKFWTVGRLRSATTASEGNPLDAETLSPTAHANPYFAHQGQPGLRHHNAGSVPPSPPDTPSVNINPPHDDVPDKATAARKEELARKLRRVASAPNAQGLFSKGAKAAGGDDDGERPATAEMGKEPLEEGKGSNKLGFADSKSEGGLAPPDPDDLGALPPPNQSALAFRRTYSSNSIKVRNVEVGPQSFDKIKLIGKGDVGKVYLVREKKSSRLYAMKGRFLSPQSSRESR